MNKLYRLIKRRLALVLVLLLSIESFAAVVGDNDGAAFITKAEFDSMKNDFQSQLDRYNSSLDNKIDGAIAAYLSGVRVGKTNVLAFVGGIKHYKDSTLAEKENARVDLYHSLNGVDNKQSTDANWYNGYEGNAIIKTIGTKGKGLFGEPVSDDGKDVLFKGYGTFTDKVTSIVSAMKADRGPTPGVAGRVAAWQLTWSMRPIADEITGNAVYDFYQPATSSEIRLFPRVYGKDTQNANYNSSAMYAQTPVRMAHERDVAYDDDPVDWLFNGNTISNLYDTKNFNGIEFKLDKKNARHSTIDGWFKIINYSFNGRTFTADNNNPIWKEWDGLEAGHNWILIGSETNGTYYNMITHVASWNNIQLFTHPNFTGYNKELYVANIQNPNRIYTNKYTNDTWVAWAQKNISSNKIILLKNNLYYWNLRYGSLLAAEPVLDSSTYKLKVKNNKSANCYIKFYTGIQSTQFDAINGIKTNKSDSTNRERILLAPGNTVDIEFEVTNSDPIFFKCSDGADITFDDTLVKQDS